MAAKTNRAKGLITALFGAGVFCFWAFGHRALLSYQEQFQLFQCTWSYFLGHLAWPGGLATYIGEYLAQMYNNYWLGSAVMAVEMMALLWLVYILCKRVSHGDASLATFVSCLVPVGLMWMYQGDVNEMPSFMIAILLALVCGVCYSYLAQWYWQLLAALIGLPVFNWLFGPASLLLGVLMSIVFALQRPARLWLKIINVVLIMGYAVACICLEGQWVNYPMDQQFVGINYYRLPTIMPWMEVIVEASIVIVALASLTQLWDKAQQKVSAAVFVAGAVAVVIGWGRFYDSKTIELIEYDYLVRIGDWDGIIKKAEKDAPDLPMSVSATNLALGMKGQLGERAFEFYQNGIEGLLPPFKRESNSMLVAAEAFFQLGLVNTAQRFYFEAMEAIPNYNKSVRCIKRMAETNLINGQYDVARKYLRMLEHTTFYSKWATRTMKMIDQGTVDAHPLYGRMRMNRLGEDFLFSERELDKILGQLYLKNPANALAKQYLLVYPLLERNLPKFMQYWQVVSQKENFCPLLCQQAIAFHCVQTHQQIPVGLVPAGVQDQLRNFAKTMTEQGKTSPALEPYRGTLWHYLLITD